MRDFKKLVIWKKSIEIVKSVYILSKILPKNEQFGLISQFTRAAVSISSNIAEGCSRNSEKDFKRFLEISLGSSYEVENLLIISTELNLIPLDKTSQLLNEINTVQKMIQNLITKIKIDINT